MPISAAITNEIHQAQGPQRTKHQRRRQGEDQHPHVTGMAQVLAWLCACYRVPAFLDIGCFPFIRFAPAAGAEKQVQSAAASVWASFESYIEALAWFILAQGRISTIIPNRCLKAILFAASHVSEGA